MKRVRFVLPLVLVFAILAFAGPARAETLSWNAVTTYTDSTPIPPGTMVSYQAYWTTNSNLSGLVPIGSSTTMTSASFNVDSAGMPRGSTIYFTCRATVGGQNSGYGGPLSWVVPTLPVKNPSIPVNLRLN